MLRYKYVLPIAYKGLYFYGVGTKELAEEFEYKLREHGEPVFTDEGNAAGTVDFFMEAPNLWELNNQLHEMKDDLESMYMGVDFDCLLQNPDEK